MKGNTLNIRRIGALSALLLTFAVLAGACSSDSKSSASAGDKTAFCKSNAEINSSLNVNSSAELVTAFKSVSPKFDQYLKDAPSEIKSDAQKLVDGAKKAISSGDPSPFINPGALQDASKNVDTFCGSASS